MLNSGIVTEWPGLFEIVRLCDNSSIHNNSRQQAPVCVRVFASAGHTISDNEFATLGIVREKPDGSYEPLPENDPSAEWFYTSARDGRFDYYPSLVHPELPETQEGQDPGYPKTSGETPPARSQPDSSIRSVERYVHCQAESGSSIRLRGVITRDTGETVYTDSRVFDSSVTLFAQSAHSLLFPQDYHCTPGLNGVSNDQRDDDTYRVSLRSGAFSFITLEEAGAGDPADDDLPLTQVQRNRRVLLAASCAGADPLSIVGSTASTATCSGHLSARITAEHPGEILLSARPPVEPCASLPGARLVAYDRQGNPHRISWADDRDQQDAAIHTPFFEVTRHAFVENAEITNIEFFQVKGLGSPIHAAPCHIYNNGYQTTYVNVVIRAVDSNSIPVDLTPAQLNSIVLVDYDTGAALSDTEWYIAQDRRDPDDLFDLYPTQGAVPSSTPAQGDQSITVWLKTKSQTSMEVAARIVLDNITYHTYQKNVEPGGRTESGRSNSSARIVAHAQDYVLRPEDFKYTGKPFVAVDTYERWKLTLKDGRYRICYSLADNLYHYEGNPVLLWTAQLTFRPGRFRWALFTVVNSTFAIAINEEPAAYGAVAMTLGKGNAFDITTEQFYLDQYGNKHKLGVRVRSNSSSTMLEWIGADYYEE